VTTTSKSVRCIVAVLTVGIGIAVARCGGGSSHDINNVIDTQAFKASLDGASVVPAVDTSGSGDADFVTNHALDTIAFDFRTDGLSDITGAFVQVGEPGATGPVIFTLSKDSSDAGADTLGANDLTPDPADGINSIDDAIDAMIDGRTYINVTTQANPNGEIRGQITER
jgi:hypothetical protein